MIAKRENGIAGVVGLLQHETRVIKLGSFVGIAWSAKYIAKPISVQLYTTRASSLYVRHRIIVPTTLPFKSGAMSFRRRNCHIYTRSLFVSDLIPHTLSNIFIKLLENFYK